MHRDFEKGVLSPFSIDRDKLPKLTPSSDPAPWVVELADGTRCTARIGGAWPIPPTGYEFTHACTGTGSTSFLFTRGTTLFDKSGSTWSVYYGDGQGSRSPSPSRRSSTPPPNSRRPALHR